MAKGFGLYCLGGTTGSGKNRIGAALAEKLGADVLSMDSMKVYRGMDIGTAKPSLSLQERAKHHMVDILDPHERMDLKRFLSLAEDVVAEKRDRDEPLVCVGGTAMYLTGLIYGVHEGPERDEDFRAKLRAERDQLGAPHLHERLRQVDPVSAARINPNDYQRIERALEVFELSGTPLGEQQQTWFSTPRFPAEVVLITWPLDILRARINERIDLMFEAGWLDEVKNVDAAGGFSQEALAALGYAEIRALVAGEATEAETRERIKIKTWQFSRRQRTWMKKFPQARQIVREPGDDPEKIADDLARIFNS